MCAVSVQAACFMELLVARSRPARSLCAVRACSGDGLCIVHRRPVANLVEPVELIRVQPGQLRDACTTTRLFQTARVFSRHSLGAFGGDVCYIFH